MNKTIVLGIVAGTAVAGGITGLVVRSFKRLREAKTYFDEANKIIDKAQNLMYEVDDPIERAQELTDLFDEDAEYELCLEPEDNIVDFPKGDE